MLHGKPSCVLFWCMFLFITEQLKIDKLTQLNLKISISMAITSLKSVAKFMFSFRFPWVWLDKHIVPTSDFHGLSKHSCIKLDQRESTVKMAHISFDVTAMWSGCRLLWNHNITQQKSILVLFFNKSKHS